MSMSQKTRRAPIAGTRVIWQAGLREMLGVSGPTFWRWRRAGAIPAPDIKIGDREGWRPETVERLLNPPCAEQQ